jgi:hypothetical protein
MRASWIERKGSLLWQRLSSPGSRESARTVNSKKPSNGDEKNEGEIAFFPDNKHTIVINSNKGYKYCLNEESNDGNWESFV